MSNKIFCSMFLVINNAFLYTWQCLIHLIVWSIFQLEQKVDYYIILLSICFSPLYIFYYNHWKQYVGLLGFYMHQHCKGYMATFQLYWWRKTSGAPPCINQHSEFKVLGGTNYLFIYLQIKCWGGTENNMSA